MPIKPASALSWRPPPRCPVCNVGILPSGRSTPFAVDAEGQIYCRDHGGTIEPTYPDEPREYEAWRKQRADAIDELEAAAAPKKAVGQ